MNKQQQKQHKRQIRHQRVRSRISGTDAKPRLAVFKANRHIYGQLIDDLTGKTLAAASSAELSKHGGKTEAKSKKTEVAKQVGAILAKKAAEKNITAVKFDRGGYAYHGRVKALAEGAREGGLKF